MKPADQPTDESSRQPAVNALQRQLDEAYGPQITAPPTSEPIPSPVVSQTQAHRYQSEPQSTAASQTEATVADVKKQLLAQVAGGARKQTSIFERVKPLLAAMAVGLLYLGLTYNEIAVAQVKQYISPGSSLSTPVITDPTQEVVIGKEPRLIIPKINVDIPVVYDVTSFDEGAIQTGLERGVVHYGTTALPGQNGNNVIVGHSSNNFFNQGKYKFAFVLLDRLQDGDTFILHYKGERYIYRVFHKAVIEPTDFSLIQTKNRPVTTLITCTPPGTSWHRLVVQAEQISPDPEQARAAEGNLPEQINTLVPGNAPSIWQRIGELFN